MSKVPVISGFSEMFEFLSKFDCGPNLPVAVCFRNGHPEDYLSFFFNADVSIFIWYKKIPFSTCLLCYFFNITCVLCFCKDIFAQYLIHYV